MALPMIVTNSTVSDIVIAGQTVPANGGTYSFPSAQIGAVCMDFNFRSLILTNAITASLGAFIFGGLNGMKVQGPCSDLMRDIASGNITLP